MFIAAALFLIAKKNPNVHQQMNGSTKCDIYPHHRLNSAIKKRSTNTCYNMDKPRKPK